MTLVLLSFFAIPVLDLRCFGALLLLLFVIVLDSLVFCVGPLFSSI